MPCAVEMMNFAVSNELRIHGRNQVGSRERQETLSVRLEEHASHRLCRLSIDRYQEDLLSPEAERGTFGYGASPRKNRIGEIFQIRDAFFLVRVSSPNPTRHASSAASGLLRIEEVCARLRVGRDARSEVAGDPLTLYASHGERDVRCPESRRAEKRGEEVFHWINPLC